jgi:hypothetical protein
MRGLERCSRPNARGEKEHAEENVSIFEHFISRLTPTPRAPFEP